MNDNIFAYDAEGYDRDGFNAKGYNREGFNREGLNELGFHHDISFDEQYVLAKDPATPADVLIKLAGSEYRNVRYAVAQNPASPAEALVTVYEHSTGQVRCSIAEHPSTPVEILSHLAKHRDVNMRRRVAGNPSTPSNVLAVLSKDKEELVKLAVAGNSSAPVEALWSLITFEGFYLSPTISRRMVSVASNPSASEEIIERLATTSNSDVRCAAAENAKSAAVLSMLVETGDGYVRQSAATNPYTPIEDLVETLSHIEKDKYLFVTGLKFNPNYKDILAHALCQKSGEPKATYDAMPVRWLEKLLGVKSNKPLKPYVPKKVWVVHPYEEGTWL